MRHIHQLLASACARDSLEKSLVTASLAGVLAGMLACGSGGGKSTNQTNDSGTGGQGVNASGQGGGSNPSGTSTNGGTTRSGAGGTTSTSAGTAAVGGATGLGTAPTTGGAAGNDAGGATSTIGGTTAIGGTAGFGTTPTAGGAAGNSAGGATSTIGGTTAIGGTAGLSTTSAAGGATGLGTTSAAGGATGNGTGGSTSTSGKTGITGGIGSIGGTTGIGGATTGTGGTAATTWQQAAQQFLSQYVNNSAYIDESGLILRANVPSTTDFTYQYGPTPHIADVKDTLAILQYGIFNAAWGSQNATALTKLVNALVTLTSSSSTGFMSVSYSHGVPSQTQQTTKTNAETGLALLLHGKVTEAAAMADRLTASANRISTETTYPVTQEILNGSALSYGDLEGNMALVRLLLGLYDSYKTSDATKAAAYRTSAEGLLKAFAPQGTIRPFSYTAAGAADWDKIYDRQPGEGQLMGVISCRVYGATVTASPDTAVKAQANADNELGAASFIDGMLELPSTTTLATPYFSNDVALPWGYSERYNIDTQQAEPSFGPWITELAAVVYGFYSPAMTSYQNILATLAQTAQTVSGSDFRGLQPRYVALPSTLHPEGGYYAATIWVSGDQSDALNMPETGLAETVGYLVTDAVSNSLDYWAPWARK